MSAQLLPDELVETGEYQFTGNAVTVDNKHRLVEAYRQRNTIAHAAETCHLSRRVVHHYINTDPAFAEAMMDAREDAVDHLESSVYERAFKSDLLAMFTLKAYRPKFRDKVNVDLDELRNQVKAKVQDVLAERQVNSIDTRADSPQPSTPKDILLNAITRQDDQ